jgi:hypothetical protein
MATITVPYTELDESFGWSEGRDEQGEWARKPYGVAWGDRWTFMRQARGVSAMMVFGGTWLRDFPLQYPDNPSLYAAGFEVNKAIGKLKTGGPMSYDDAVIVVHFREPIWNYQPLDDPFYLNSLSQDAGENQNLQYCTQELDTTVEWYPVPGNQAVYYSQSNPALNNTQVNVPLSVPVTVIQMVLTWHDMPYLPLGRVQTYADVLNAGTFLGNPRGTVKMDAVKTSRKVLPDGKPGQDVQLVLKWRKQDWNKYIQPDCTFEYVCFGRANGQPDTTKMTFAYVDMAPLLAIGSGSAPA